MKFKSQDKQNQLIENFTFNHIVVGVDIAVKFQNSLQLFHNSLDNLLQYSLEYYFYAK